MEFHTWWIITPETTTVKKIVAVDALLVNNDYVCVTLPNKQLDETAKKVSRESNYSHR